MSEATEALEAILKTLPPSANRLPFEAKCAAFYAIKIGFPIALVGRVFGVSPSALSYLSTCLDRPKTGAWRYRKVAAAYHELGQRAFGERYFTLDWAEAFKKARAGIEPGMRPPKRGANPSAKPFRSFRIESEPGHYFIAECVWRNATLNPDGWDDDEPELKAGWTWKEKHDDGQTIVVPRRFETPGRAFHAVWETYGETGRPPKDSAIEWVDDNPS